MTNQLLNKNPSPGSTKRETPVYKGCLTRTYGPLVISCFLGTFINIKIWDQIQITIPKYRRINPILFKIFDFGILKSEGKTKYEIKQMIAIDQTKGLILFPLPIKSFSFFIIYIIARKRFNCSLVLKLFGYSPRRPAN